jgi:hypothetical protein
VKLLKFGWPAVLAILSLPAHGTSFFIRPMIQSSIASDPAAVVIDSAEGLGSVDLSTPDDTMPRLGPESIALLIRYDSVPEPGTFLLVGAALVGVGLLKRGRKSDRK